MDRKFQRFDRRTVLTTIGAGMIGGAVLPGSASADKQHYGNGNGLDEFLNEEALLKDNPIWDGEIADRRGESVVDIAVGAMTSVDIPSWVPAPPIDQLPVAFDPHVVKVSPGATVRWTWVSNPLGHPVPHDVVSLVDEDGDPVVDEDGHPRFHSPHHHYKEPGAEEPDEEDLPTFEVEFSERGNHLYYCSPHGAPYSHGKVENPETGEMIDFYNEFGMRGAVKVAGNPLSPTG